MSELKRKVLMLDDDRFSLLSVKKQIEKVDIECKTIDDPKTIMETIELFEPEVLLLDIMMPHVSGLDILADIRQIYSRFELPVILFSGKDGSDDIIKGLRIEANDYIVKPAKAEILLARINTQLSLRDLYFESLKAGELDVIHNMITTLSHEINNPLAIVHGNLSLIAEDEAHSIRAQKCIRALDRVSEIVKTIAKVAKESNTKSLEKVEYAEGYKYYNFKKTS